MPKNSLTCLASAICSNVIQTRSLGAKANALRLGYLLLTVLGRTGVVGECLSPFGLSLIFNEPAVILAGFVAGLPLVVRPLQAAFSSSRLTELEEAARIHGANDWQIFRRITLPLVRPSLAAGLLLGCARVSGEVGMTMMLGGNIASAPIPFRLKSLMRSHAQTLMQPMPFALSFLCLPFYSFWRLKCSCAVRSKVNAPL